MIQLVPPLQFLHNLVLTMSGRFHPLDRLMVVRVKELSFGLDRREAGASEDVKQLAVNQFHPFVELLGDALVAVLQGALLMSEENFTSSRH